jgi:hypothetical protein
VLDLAAVTMELPSSASRRHENGDADNGDADSGDADKNANNGVGLSGAGQAAAGRTVRARRRGSSASWFTDGLADGI